MQQPPYPGVFAFVWNDEMEAHWRTRLRASMGDGPDLEAGVADIIAEAKSARIEVTPDGRIASSALGKEYYRVPFEPREGGFRFQKPDGPVVDVSQPDPNTVIATESGKPTLTFTRVSG